MDDERIGGDQNGAAVRRRARNDLLENDGLAFAGLAEKLATTMQDDQLRIAVAQLAAKGLAALEF
jgi:hypothetical protein